MLRSERGDGARPRRQRQAHGKRLPTEKVIRGGGYAAYPPAMRAAKRASHPADIVVSNVGFRCAR